MMDHPDNQHAIPVLSSRPCRLVVYSCIACKVFAIQTGKLIDMFVVVADMIDLHTTGMYTPLPFWPILIILLVIELRLLIINIQGSSPMFLVSMVSVMNMLTVL